MDPKIKSPSQDFRHQGSLHHDKSHRRAFALILVLSVLAILTLLILSVFMHSRTESQGSFYLQSQFRTTTLEQSALSIVISQIHSATAPDLSLNQPTFWSSQPGAIRQYRQDGTLNKGYKLYSDAQMIFTGDETVFGRLRPPQDWDSPANSIHYTDLNEPVIRTLSDATQRLYFPIFDPRSIHIEGVRLESNLINGVQIPNSENDVNARAPMPAQWLYLLKNGQIGALDATGQFPGATADNPIVGRIAFWTDDESAKLNLNTSSEPTPWDTPRAVNKDDLNYGKFQPAKNEFQRYSGHPFSTSLSPIFFPNQNPTTAQKEDIYRLIPRVKEGGTVGGTVSLNTSETSLVLVPDSQRLFSSPHEIIFSPNTLAGQSRTLATSAIPSLTAQLHTEKVERQHFFATTHSNASELTSYGMPRVSMWPIRIDTSTSQNKRTQLDQLIAFCTTVNGRPYYFQRDSSVSTTSDHTNIQRNRELYSYLQKLTSGIAPGTNSSFEAKWTEGAVSDRDQILTEIFDYIRTTNQKDPHLGSGEQFTNAGIITPIKIDANNTKGFGRFYHLSEFALHFNCRADGALSPKRHPQDPASYDALTPSEKVVEAAFLVEAYTPSQGYPTINNGHFVVEVIGLDKLKIKTPNHDVSLGMPASASRTGLGGGFHTREWGGSTGFRPFIGGMGASYPFLGQPVKIDRVSQMEFSGGNLTVNLYRSSISAANLVQTIQLTFPSAQFPVPDRVSTGTQSYRDTGSAPTTSAESWWRLSERYGRVPGHQPHAPGEDYLDPARRWPGTGGNPPGFKAGDIFRREDVVRTLVPYHGDMRLVAARTQVDANTFRPHVYYHDLNRRIDHLGSESSGPQLLYGFANEPGVRTVDFTQANSDTAQLTRSLYHYSKMPDVPQGTGAYNRYGDFDNGVAQLLDGSYINMPDQGNVSGTFGNPYFSYAYQNPTEILFSANRLMPSAVMLGSLPTGVKRNRPWETLLFRPQSGHPGSQSPPDHLLLDLFWMPVVEPYAISEPHSTSGRVNMNQQLLPFPHIIRNTALHGVLKSERPLAIPNTHSRSAKLWDHDTSDYNVLPNDASNADAEIRQQWDALYKGNFLLRKPINIAATLTQFDDVFHAGNIFKTATEICNIHLVREGESLDSLKNNTFWDNHLQTGDNTRERPYANLYPRLTTRSNTYKVHLRVQAIQKARSSPANRFDPSQDKIISEIRSQHLIERYLPHNLTQVADFATAANPFTLPSLDRFYQIRILNSKKFAP